MTTFPPLVLKVTFGAMAGTAIGEFAGRVLFGAGTEMVRVTGDWLVDIRTVCAVGAVVLVGTWGEQTFGELQKSIVNLDNKLSGLPCRLGNRPEACPERPAKPSP